MGKSSNLWRSNDIVNNSTEFDEASFQLREVYADLIGEDTFVCTKSDRDIADIKYQTFWFCRPYEMSSIYKDGFNESCRYNDLKRVELHERVDTGRIFDAATPETAIAVLMASLRNEGIKCELISHTIKYSDNGRKAVILAGLILTDEDDWDTSMEICILCYKTLIN